MRCRLSLLLVAPLLLTSCYVQENDSNTLALGDVSLGQQFIDLQRAMEAGALTDAEYTEIKRNLIASTRSTTLEDDS